MRYQKINSNRAVQNWSEVITENTNIKDASKLKWISEMLEIQEVELRDNASLMNEHYGLQGPEASGRMGDVAWGDVAKQTGDFLKPDFKKGSGDVSQHQLAFAMNVASYTIGLDLLPVIPTEFPSVVHGFVDYIYSANLEESKKDQGTTEIFIELQGSLSGTSKGSYDGLVKGDKVFLGLVPTVATGDLKDSAKTLYGTFLGKNRINGNPIVRYEGLVSTTANGTTTKAYVLGAVDVESTPSQGLKLESGADHQWALIKGTSGTTSTAVIDGGAFVTTNAYVSRENDIVFGDLVSAIDQFVPEFSTPDAKYDGNDNLTASRKVGELGTQNIISLRVFSKQVEIGTQELQGQITRTQKRDLSAYGIDGLGELFKGVQNELTQSLNKNILQSQFRMGVTTASKLKNAQGIDLNLYIGDPALNQTKSLSEFGLAEFRDINGVDRTAEFPAVKNAESNSSAENNVTRARRIITRIQACSNLINTIGRFGSADFVVMNAQLATAIQDISGFVVNPFDNTLTKNDNTLYNVGTINGKLQVYVDPLMGFLDNRILVGRKGEANDQGLKLFVYTLGEITQTISEKSMSDKIVVTNRYAIVPCGFHPEMNYFTIAVANDYGII